MLIRHDEDNWPHFLNPIKRIALVLVMIEHGNFLKDHTIVFSNPKI